ncbi:SgcJ/EcaC family oxidoreductase [Streptomyces violaceusniger]|uniref:SgcJ/EcaC family oxidoreductase n=1 Tax=Streptomyces violaceusniger TaxID=68280 RepID=UPI00131DC4C0|nr:SgcJ/EcaC family oxidoreductase [Streptomyces hygroscopicus]
MTATDDERIQGLWDAMARGWAEGDAHSFAAVFAEDCDFTTVRGEKPPGRAGIAAGHDQLLRTVYRSTRLDARVQSIRYPRPDLATVNVESTVVASDGTSLARTHALAVVERDATAGADGAWRITAFHNMIPAPRPAAPPASEN